MGTFEINQEEVNVEEIMKKIRENIRKKGMEAYPIEIDEIRTNFVVADFSNGCSTKRDLEYINSNWDI